jgi:hypothetical protein
LRLEPLARELVGAGFRGETLFDQVVGRRLVLLGERRRPDAIERDVMVGQNQSVRRGERAGPAAAARHETDRRVAQAVEIGGRQPDAVFRGHRLERQLVDAPHAFVSEDDSAANSECGED